MTSPRRIALYALALTACGADPPPSTQACGAFAGPALRASVSPTQLAVVGVSPRYDAGRVRALSLGDLAMRQLPIEATGDTVVRALGTTLALLHRAVGNQDNLTLFDPRTGAVCQVPLVTDAEARASRSRPSANGHDALAVDDGHLYVARYAMHSVAVIDVAAGAVASTVDLASEVGPGEGVYPDALARVGDEVWVTLQRFDDDDALLANPTRPGLVARIDPRTHARIGAYSLTNPNPYGPLVASADGRARLVTTFGSYNVIGDGAVESIDVATGAVTVLVREDDPGIMGNLDAVAVVDARHLVLRVSAERRGTAALDDLRVILFDLETRAATLLLRASQWGAAAPVVVGDRIFVGDPGSGPYHAGAGVRVYSSQGAELRSIVAMEAGLMPYDVQPMR
jgi:hypothetical protein